MQIQTPKVVGAKSRNFLFATLASCRRLNRFRFLYNLLEILQDDSQYLVMRPYYSTLDSQASRLDTRIFAG
jgi:hypothetical protein